MRFNEIIKNQLEVDDGVIEDYINSRDKDFKYSVEDFINFFTTEYYVEDFVEMTDIEYTLEEKFFLNELNRVKEQINND